MLECHKVIIITLLCTVLGRMAPAIADSMDTTTTGQPPSWTAVSEVPREGAGREGRETQGMSILLFIIGVVSGLGLGLLGYRAFKGWRGRQERQRDIDQITAQFQALFRESAAGKNPYP
jgi:hypothetical protein